MIRPCLRSILLAAFVSTTWAADGVVYLVNAAGARAVPAWQTGAAGDGGDGLRAACSEPQDRVAFLVLREIPTRAGREALREAGITIGSFHAAGGGAYVYKVTCNRSLVECRSATAACAPGFHNLVPVTVEDKIDEYIAAPDLPPPTYSRWGSGNGVSSWVRVSTSLSDRCRTDLVEQFCDTPLEHTESCYRVVSTLARLRELARYDAVDAVHLAGEPVLCNALVRKLTGTRG